VEDSWQIFIDDLIEDNYTEYGDFKREMDSQLRRLVETSPPFSEEQAHEIARLRLDYLWQDHPDEDIEPIKRDIKARVEKIAHLH
jgi:hypothetical protein